MRAQEREAPREYIDRESHYVWGKRYLLKIQAIDAPPKIELKHDKLVLSIRPGTLLQIYTMTFSKAAAPQNARSGWKKKKSAAESWRKLLPMQHRQ